MQGWEVCSVQRKSGQTVFSTKTAARMQCWLHAYCNCTYHSGFSWRCSYSGVELMCATHCVLEALQEKWIGGGLIATLRWCRASFPISPVCSSQWRVCWCASLPGLAGTLHAGAAAWCRVSDWGEGSSPVIRCALHTPRSNEPTSLSLSLSSLWVFESFGFQAVQ